MESHGENSDVDDDDLIGDIADINEKELFSDGSQSGDEEGSKNNDDEGDGDRNDEAIEVKERRIVKPKREVKNPQPKLNFETLQGPKGLITLNNSFKDFKYKGDGNEQQDLAALMKHLEQWAYRLHPKFHFEDSLLRLESLGKKKAVQVYLKKVRIDMIDSYDVVRQVDDDENNDDNDNDNDTVNRPAYESMDDQFDQLLSQQIEMQINQNTQNTQISQVTPSTQASPSLTAEQMERIERNRRLAKERQLAKLKQINNLDEVNISTDPQPRTSGTESELMDSSATHDEPIHYC